MTANDIGNLIGVLLFFGGILYVVIKHKKKSSNHELL